MQSYSYSVPSRTPHDPNRRPTPRKPRGWMVMLALALVGGAVWSTGVPYEVGTSSIGWLLGGPASAGERERKADGLMLEGEAHLRSGALEAAIQCFDDALHQNPVLLGAYQRGRDARYLKGDDSPPLAALVPDARQRVAFLLTRAEAERKGQPGAARDDVDQALAIAPTDLRALSLRGALLADGLDATGALSAYSQALKLHPNDLALNAAMLALRYRTGDLDTAVVQAVALYKPLAARSHDLTVHAGLLEAYIHTGMSFEDIRARHISEAPQLSPTERKLAVGMAYMQHYQRNPNWNRESYTRVLTTLANVLESDAATTAAERIAARRLLLEAHVARSERFAERSDHDAARAELDRALALRSGLPTEGVRFAEVYAARARLSPAGDAANRHLEASLSLAPSPAVRDELTRAYANLGLSLLGAGKAKEALKPLEKAVRLDPRDPAQLARYTQALLAVRHPQSFQSCLKAAAGVPRAEFYGLLIQGLAQAGRGKEADKALAAARRAGLDPAGLARVEAEHAAGRSQRTQARKRLLQAIEHRNDPATWVRLAGIERQLAGAEHGALRMRHLSHARDALRHALALSAAPAVRADLLAVLRAMAESRLADQDSPGAAQLASEALVIAPRNPALSLVFARSLARQLRSDEAQAACRSGLSGLAGAADPAHAPLREQLGQLLRSRKQYAEAIEEFKRGLVEEVQAPPATVASLYYGLAFAYADLGQREEALNTIQQYVFWSIHDRQQAVRVSAVQELERRLTPPAKS